MVHLERIMLRRHLLGLPFSFAIIALFIMFHLLEEMVGLPQVLQIFGIFFLQ